MKLRFGCLILAFLFLSACHDPEISFVETEDVKQYGQFNQYVEETLSTDFAGTLPATELVNADSRYYYNYTCSAFGDPNFLVYVSCDYADPQVLQKELDRVASVAMQTLSVNDSKTLFIVHPEQKSAEQYRDAEVLDGLSFTFEMVMADSQTGTVEYVSAHQQDNQPKSDILLDFLAVWDEGLNK